MKSLLYWGEIISNIITVWASNNYFTGITLYVKSLKILLHSQVEIIVKSLSQQILAMTVKIFYVSYWITAV